MTALLPSARETFVNPDGTPSRSFYSYLLQQSRDAGGSGDSLAQVALDVSTLAKRLGAEDGKPSSVSYPVFQFQGFTSLFAAQNGSVVSLSLQNDSAAPGNSYCYGTGTDGTKGWFPISQAIAGSSTITATVGTDGVTTLTLPDVSVTSGGTLKKRAFDAQGRLSQEASATTDDLAEGASNLYFTNARVLATTLTGLSTGTSTPVAATDSVLVGIGKLQAQVNTNATAISGKEPAIASGTTAQYWRGDKSWRDFATDVRAAVLTGLSTATSAVISATDTVLGALGKLQAQITNLLPLDGSQTMTGTLNIQAPGLQINMGVAHPTIATGPIQSAASDGNLVNENISCSGTVAFAPRHNFYRGRGSNAAPTDVLNGDTLGGIQMISRVGGAWQNSASVLAVVDGVPGASFAPGSLQFSTSDGLSGIAIRWLVRAAGHFQPLADNALDVGSASNRARVIYAGTGAINTSDARDKGDVIPLTPSELAASIALSREIGTYQWLASIQAKGSDARWHAGLTVQRAIEVMQAHGLDPFRYGFICYDQWDEQPEIISSWPAREAVLDESGNVIEPAIDAGSEVVQPYRPAGDRYSFRHDELLLFIARGIDARLSALESKVAA